jgi:hypothetical protein
MACPPIVVPPTTTGRGGELPCGRVWTAPTEGLLVHAQVQSR